MYCYHQYILLFGVIIQCYDAHDGVLLTPGKGDIRTAGPFVEEVDEGLVLGPVKLGLSDFTGR